MIRISDLDVLMALHPVEWRNGRKILNLICEAQGLTTKPMEGIARLYVVLDRLESSRLAEGRWEEGSAARGGYVGRSYLLTSDGYKRKVELDSVKEIGRNIIPETS